MRQNPALERADNQDANRRIERQHIMRQLGDDEFENDPRRQQPGQQELRARLAPRAPDSRHSKTGKRRAGPERDPEQQEVESGRCAVRLLCARNLVQHIAAEGVREERVACLEEDQNEPRQHEHQRPHQAPDRTQTPQPRRRTIENRERHHSQCDEHQDQRAFEQDTAGHRRPEYKCQLPRWIWIVIAALPRQIGARHRSHNSSRCQQQHRVCLRKTRLDTEQDRTAHQQAGKQCPAPRDESERCPVCEKHRADGADQRRHAIEPDAHLCARKAESRCALHDGRLRPVDTDRLFVPDFVLETDIDEVVVFHHLLGGLREAGFVTIDRRNVEEAGQEKQQPGDNQQQSRPGVAADREIDHAHESASGIFLFHGFARRAKSGSWVALSHRFRIRGNQPPDNSLDRVY